MSAGERPRTLTYSEYINDRAIREALRIPQPPPAGQTPETWPVWSPAGGNGATREPWAPGDPWPRGGNWSHDEVLFIRTHQAFEVWFAVVLHEVEDVLRQVRSQLDSEGLEFPSVDFGKRRGDIREFPPERFPRLKRVAESFQNSMLRDHVLQMPTPGRYWIRGFKLETSPEWAAQLQRAAQALQVTIPFFEVLGTMTPRRFLEFRGRLAPASGFGSAQFREIELILGLREINEPRLKPSGGTAEPDEQGRELPRGMLRPTENTPPEEAAVCYYRHHPPEDWPRLARRFREPSLRDLAYGLLNVNAFKWRDQWEIDAAVDEFAAHTVREALEPYDRAQGVLGTGVGEHIEELGKVLAHRETIVAAMLAAVDEDKSPNPLLHLRDFLDACMALDAALLHWRDHHIRFVEKMIGRRPGTGGTGVGYLRQTTDAKQAAYYTHAFPALWHARSLVQRPL